MSPFSIVLIKPLIKIYLQGFQVSIYSLKNYTGKSGTCIYSGRLSISSFYLFIEQGRLFEENTSYSLHGINHQLIFS